MAARVEGQGGYLDAYCGTESYMAPEILTKKKFIQQGKVVEKPQYQGKEVDLFALGVLLFVLYSGDYPFSKANQN